MKVSGDEVTQYWKAWHEQNIRVKVEMNVNIGKMVIIGVTGEYGVDSAIVGT